jgi:hypothetical protein
MKELKKIAINALAARLSEYGFKKTKYGYVKAVNKDLHQLIHCNFVSRQNHLVECLIMVGVYSKETADTLREITGAPAGYGVMVGRNLEMLIPKEERTNWMFSIEDDNVYIDSKIKEIIEAVKVYGFPYMDNFSSEPNFQSELEKRGAWHLLPIWYYIQGEKECALLEIRQRTEQLTNALSNDKQRMYNSCYRGHWNEIPPMEYRELHSYLKYAEQFENYLSSI